jgi:DNA-binding protein H-NS
MHLGKECKYDILLMKFFNLKIEVCMGENPLKNKQEFRLLVKELTSISDIEQLGRILENQKNELQKKIDDDAIKAQEIENTMKLLAEKGINKKTLLQFLGVAEKESDKNITVDETQYIKDSVAWSGKGRVPLAFKDVKKEDLFLYKVD